MKLTKKDTKMLLILGGGLLFVLLYFGAYRPLMNAAELVRIEHDALLPELQELEMHNENVEFYHSEIDRIVGYATRQLAYYPSDIKEEDYLLWLLDWEARIGQDITVVSLTDPTPMQSFACYIREDGDPFLTEITAYQRDASVTSEMGYTQFKDSLDLLYSSPTRTSLGNVSLSYDATTGLLGASISLYKIFLQYDGAEYIPTPLPDTNLGVGNLFGSN